ncbi:30S ribosomal protein S5 [Pelagerythrobacter aerophilus]|uniref:Small ribosomal subunit protein uS5 n=1 Tax=Pelagerythrobacter aerophilus TaxID=2306995 RepID=A0A418NLU7_9SPHN|nr:30S ribosomal protein S5 [Pelagerythrobacter aerophilus]RIV81212.1 30S ribosomal protein S5 [Pelagerythrobacter aerophilus]
MMAEENNTENTETPKVEDAKVEETQAEATEAKAEAAAETEAAPATAEEPKVDNAGSTPTSTTAPTEAAENQSAQAGDPSQPRGRGGRGGGDRGGRDGGGRGRGRGRDDRRGNRREEEDDGIIEKLVHINRVSKTVKGGKRFGFAALVVVGDGSGRVGFGHGKAREVPEAISKATASARKKMIRVPLKEGRTLHHDGNGRFGAGKVTVRTAPPGTGIIAGGPMRAVFESLGVADVVTKSVGTSNPYNMIRATFDALTDQTSPKSVAQRRGKKVADLLGRGGASAAEAEADAAAIAE